MRYLARTTLKEMCGAAFQQFDTAVRSALVQITGLELSDARWQQVALRAGSGGLGLQASDDVADPAYLPRGLPSTAKQLWFGAATPGTQLLLLVTWRQPVHHTLRDILYDCWATAGVACA